MLVAAITEAEVDPKMKLLIHICHLSSNNVVNSRKPEKSRECFESEIHTFCQMNTSLDIVTDCKNDASKNPSWKCWLF